MSYTRQTLGCETCRAIRTSLINRWILEGSRWTSYQAALRLSQGLPAAKEVAIAKAFASNACQRAGATAHQLHGGMGVDLDNDLHFYFERAKAMELKFGAAPMHLKALEAELGM